MQKWSTVMKQRSHTGNQQSQHGIIKTISLFLYYYHTQVKLFYYDTIIFVLRGRFSFSGFWNVSTNGTTSSSDHTTHTRWISVLIMTNSEHHNIGMRITTKKVVNFDSILSARNTIPSLMASIRRSSCIVDTYESVSYQSRRFNNALMV